MTNPPPFSPGDYLLLHFRIRFKPTLWVTLAVPGHSSPVTIRIPDGATFIKKAGSTRSELEVGDAMVLRCKVLYAHEGRRATVRIPGFGPIAPIQVPDDAVVERDPLVLQPALHSNPG